MLHAIETGTDLLISGTEVKTVEFISAAYACVWYLQNQGSAAHECKRSFLYLGRASRKANQVQ